ncbi:MAG: S16 family serine protease [Archangium sp.]|nr:S16 family serine protease [Archangium sp.]
MRAVSVATVDGKPTGRTTPVTVGIARNRARVPSVLVVEEFTGGSGDQWLTTLWQAAFVATQATASSLLHFGFSLRVGGRIDGPSAGLLTASTLMALIRGKKVLPHTTMTGSINPDGSAGPVDGILLMLRAAAHDGVKRFGFPLGGRQQVDASGETADLLAEGQKLGVEVKELGSLDEAYLFLTGETLPRPAAASDGDMELWPAELAAITRLTGRVRADFEAELPALETALAKVDPKSAASWRELIERSAREADDFAKNGDTVRAMVVWSSLLTTTRVATQDALLQSSLDARDLGAVFAQLEVQENALPLERSNLRREIDAHFPNTTRANDIYALDVLESVVTQGRALRALADAKKLLALSRGASAGSFTDENYQAFRRLTRRYAEDLLRLREELKNGQRFLALYASLPRLKKSMPPIDAGALAASYASAGVASRASFEARAGAFSQKDEAWLDLVAYGDLLATETDGRARLVLAARQTIYSAYLVNTYDALGGQVDAKGVFSIRNSRALAAQLELARVRVLQSCGRAKREVGGIPFPARMRFLNARAAREGSDRQKADTLAELWISNWWCEFAVRDGKK